MLELIPISKEIRKEVIRLTTSYWQNQQGIHFRKSLIPLKRKSCGHQCLSEDVPMIGADLVIKNIINLNESKDGIYEVIICNESKDWETGYLDSWEYKLIPFEEKIDSEPKSDIILP